MSVSLCVRMQVYCINAEEEIALNGTFVAFGNRASREVGGAHNGIQQVKVAYFCVGFCFCYIISSEV